MEIWWWCVEWIRLFICIAFLCMIFFMGINFYEWDVRPRCDMECSKEYKSASLLRLSLSLSLSLFLSLCSSYFHSWTSTVSLLVVGGKEGRRFDCVTATLVDCRRPFSLFFSPLSLVLSALCSLFLCVPLLLFVFFPLFLLGEISETQPSRQGDRQRDRETDMWHFIW